MTKKIAKKAASGAAKSNAAPKKTAAAGGKAKELAWLTPAKLREIRADLVGMRDDILKNVRKQQVEEGVDNGDSVDQASQSIEKELSFELSDNERTTLDMVEAAIRKIDNGTYGLCEATQRPIGRLRL
ncbi:MAG: TraR/DksA family transcriptional regulator, partial [Elusimicrobia bacterium]|nr:TraR/DksA family transcriptional regulator [Elusimicrobiota bacterium]